MSVSVLVLSLALTGQVALDDRYGSPPATSTPTTPASPFNETPRRKASPPPAFEPPAETTPGISVQDHQNPVAAPARPGNLTVPPTSPIETTRPTPQNDVKPAAMMRSMVTVPASSRLTGQPIRLAGAVVGTSSRLEQSQRIEAYWDLSSSVADYCLGVREQDELQRLRAGMSNVGPAWQQAETEMGLRISASERAAKASQYRLASLIGRDGGSLPLPADLPHCGD